MAQATLFVCISPEFFFFFFIVSFLSVQSGVSALLVLVLVIVLNYSTLSVGYLKENYWKFFCFKISYYARICIIIIVLHHTSSLHSCDAILWYIYNI